MFFAGKKTSGIPLLVTFLLLPTLSLTVSSTLDARWQQHKCCTGSGSVNAILYYGDFDNLYTYATYDLSCAKTGNTACGFSIQGTSTYTPPAPNQDGGSSTNYNGFPNLDCNSKSLGATELDGSTVYYPQPAAPGTYSNNVQLMSIWCVYPLVEDVIGGDREVLTVQ